MLLVDTGPLLAYLNRNDPDHARCAALFDARSDELVVTPYVLTEACYLVAKYIGADAEINLVEAVAAADLSQAEITAADLARIALWRALHRRLSSGHPVISVRIGPLDAEQQEALPTCSGSPACRAPTRRCPCGSWRRCCMRRSGSACPRSSSGSSARSQIARPLAAVDGRTRGALGVAREPSGGVGAAGAA
jgi:predicted nucleic acid-binding protein